MRSARTVALALVALAATASPAGAAPLVAKDAQRFWFYWIAPLLVLAGFAIVGMLVLGYYLRVLRPRWRGRKAQ